MEPSYPTSQAAHPPVAAGGGLSLRGPPSGAARFLALVGAEWEENLSLRCLAAAVLAAGHRVEVVPFNRLEDVRAVAARLAGSGYDIVGLSVTFQHRVGEFFELARVLRGLGYQGHICCGGHVATAAWHELLQRCPEADTVVRHDGEETLPALLEVLGQPEAWLSVAGVCARGPAGEPLAGPPRAQPDLDALPFALRDRPHAQHAGVAFAPISGSRGCYADCAYCCINTYNRASEGRRLRFRSPEDLAEEMAWLHHHRGVRIFCFHDDTFFLPRPRDTLKRLQALRAVLDRREVGRVGIVAKCRPDQLSLELLLEARQVHGVFRLYLGIENGSEAGLAHLGRRHDLACCRRALDLFREAGMFACFNILLFEPWTRFEDLQDNLALLRQTTDFPWNFCRAEVYSGTRLQQQLMEQGRLRGNILGYSYDIEDRRVELAFRLMAICFAGRNFAAEGVANTNTGMGYEGAVLRHFYGEAGEPLAREVDQLTREINRDTVQRLEELLCHVRCIDLDAPGADEAACDFAEQLATKINLGDLQLSRRQQELRARIKAMGASRSPLTR